MDSRFQGLLARLVQTRTSGQSIPLIALMIVTLFGMVGLAVDVGNTYAEQRKVTSGANAAAIAGMNAYIRGGSGVTDQEVYNAIVESLRTNGIDVTAADSQLTLNAAYLGADGKAVNNGCQTVGCGGAAPQNVGYIKVDIEGTVDTFFARVVGRPTLPLDALSYAGLCPPSSGLYPIAIDSSVLEGDRFKDHGNPDEFGEMGGQFRGYTWRRVYVHENGVSGSFSWLRWKEDKDPNGYSAKSENALQASLTAPGNLNQGFDEAPWPETNMVRPDVYPEKPGQLNIGDWVYGASGAKRSKDVRGLIEGHISNGTIMILPIYDVAVGNGVNGSFRVSRLGAFVMIGYNEKNGSQPYFDLVFLGDARNSMACTTTAVEPETLGLAGTVDIWPEYRTVPTSRRPVQYVVVLDVSGSMNYAFDGRGIRGSSIYQCGNSPDPTANANRHTCNPNDAYAWNPQEERRIYVAKKAVQRLVEVMNLPGNTGYESNRPPDQMLLVSYNDGIKSTSNWSSNPTQLSQWVLDAGKTSKGYYYTSGGTNGAAGLYRAAQRLQSAPKDITHSDGQKYEYKRAVIFVTDGVSNNFLDTSRSNLSGGFSGNNTYPSGHWCRSASHVAEEPLCMTNDVGGIYDPDGKNWDRPISAMVNTSNEFLKPLADVYVVALSSIPSTGLRDGVASFTSFYAEAPTLTRDADGRTNVDRIFENINTQIEYGDCVPQADNQWLKQIMEENAASDLPYPTVGEVFVRDSSTGASYAAPIKANSDGFLSYEFSNLPQGTYQMTAYAMYRHPSDTQGFDGLPMARVYDRIYMQEKNFEDGIAVTVKPSQNFGGLIQQDLQLKLSGDVCAVN